MKISEKEDLVVELPEKITIKKNETLADVIKKILFVEGGTDNTIVIMHKQQVICPKCKSQSVKAGRRDYDNGGQAYKCKNKGCKYQFVPSETFPQMRHKLTDIILGLECLYKSKITLRKASENLKGKGLSISHNTLGEWKKQIPGVLRVFVNNIKANPNDVDAISALESIRKDLSWLNLNKTDKQITILFYAPMQIKKKTGDKTNVIKCHEKDDTIEIKIKGSTWIEINKKDKDGQRFIMALLAHRKVASKSEIAKEFHVSSQTVANYLNRYLEGGFSNLINKSGGSESKLTPNMKGDIILYSIECLVMLGKISKQIIAKRVNEKIINEKDKISYKTVERFLYDINFIQTGNELKSFIESIGCQDSDSKKKNSRGTTTSRNFWLKFLQVNLIKKRAAETL
ncbi:MAG: hypothetical protein CVT90_00155 [Candidatus Altiarchaeales archaeon HGW-Altiarchaeales-3]|nr:MAG: hypothetical protein CVT90_00155 [Candidatus Altiarchaeales archaeon HGW-Altiarchaeales-3]